jgi:aspartate-semialdehyde dehydrogenase
MKIAIIGATGLVGREVLKVIPEFFDAEKVEIIAVASPRSAGKTIDFQGKTLIICLLEDAIAQKPDVAIFAIGATVSRQYAPLFVAAGITVIDNSSAWRMDKSVPLVVPEINASVLKKSDKLIANPNCSTIQLVMALAPLHRKYGIKRLVVSTYQSVSGSGLKGVSQLAGERKGKDSEKAYPYPIDLNILPHAGKFTENNYTEEEIKLVNETRKILDAPSIAITATVVRVPVMVGHCESVNVEFLKEFDIEEVRNVLQQTSGVVLQDDPANNIYPTPLLAEGKNEVFVGRIRRDESQPKSLNMWIVADNLRKGAATNAVQIAQYLMENPLP